MNKYVRLILILTLGFSLFTLPSYAEESIQELKEQVEALQRRVEQLESQQGLPPAPSQRFDRGWDPFAEIERMQREMDRMLNDSLRPLPGSDRGMFDGRKFYDNEFNLQETEEGYVVKFDITGVDKNKIDIEINEHSITVSGEYSEEHKDESPRRFYHTQRFGTFLKTIPLPIDADTANVQTEQKGDQLVITLPKK